MWFLQVNHLHTLSMVVLGQEINHGHDHDDISIRIICKRLGLIARNERDDIRFMVAAIGNEIRRKDGRNLSDDRR